MLRFTAFVISSVKNKSCILLVCYWLWREDVCDVYYINQMDFGSFTEVVWNSPKAWHYSQVLIRCMCVQVPHTHTWTHGCYSYISPCLRWLFAYLVMFTIVILHIPPRSPWLFTYTLLCWQVLFTYNAMLTFVIYILFYVHLHGYSHALPYSGSLFVYSSTPTIIIHIPAVLPIVIHILCHAHDCSLSVQSVRAQKHY